MGQSDAERRRFVRQVCFALAWIAFLISVAALAVRYAPLINHLELASAALSPYLIWGGAISAALLLTVTGRRRLATVALVPLLIGIAVKSPAFIEDSHPAGNTVPLRVLTINLYDGAADAADVAAAARDHADVVVVQELPESAARSLAQNGLDAQFPYSSVHARSNAAGVGIWSRFPIVQSSKISRYELGAVTASVRVPTAASDVTVADIHLAGPWPQPLDRWREEIGALPDTLRELAAGAGPGAVVVAGDFNATTDFQPFRRLYDAGFADAVEQAGDGLNRTYPADSMVPPIVGIDHILTYNSWATDTDEVPIDGTDHMGLIATIQIPAA
jgi:endonuclease/exonuclease/phosphatase (EEP) superfamily protein YafD